LLATGAIVQLEGRDDYGAVIYALPGYSWTDFRDIHLRQEIDKLNF